MSHLDEGTLTALLDGEIPSDVLPSITSHLEGCAACRSLLEELRQLAGEADSLVTSLGDGLATPVGTGVVVPNTSVRRTGTLRLVAWAATVVMAAGLGYWVGLPVATPPQMLAESTALPAAVEVQENRVPTVAELPSVESTQPVRSTAAAANRRAISAAAEPAAGAAPPQVVAQDAPATLGRAAARNDLQAAQSADASSGFRAELASPRAAAAPAPPAEGLAALRDRQEIAVESFAPIEFVDAVARMGGTLRLIDGLVPDRLEASTATIRVIYPLLTGELVLEQRRIGDSVSVSLRGPISPDSLAVLRRKVR
ncbi:MAG: hypothetical protein SGI84_15320 [Gemmatimonadota bacterium]|nr:hypothetical protein [Gemmatimonadota bacterium]